MLRNEAGGLITVLDVVKLAASMFSFGAAGSTEYLVLGWGRRVAQCIIGDGVVDDDQRTKMVRWKTLKSRRGRK